MASPEIPTQSKKKEFKMELASVEPACGSVPAKAVDLSALTSHHPTCDKRAERETAFGPLVQERPLETPTKQPPPESEQLSSDEDSSSRGESLRRLSFLKKLWDVIESDLFESIWWGDNRKYIVIDKDLFKEEILGRRGCMKIFESETMESFEQELHEHEFVRKLQDFPNSGLAGPAAGEIHFYCSKYFEHFPKLLMKYKKAFLPQNQTPAEFSPEMNLHARSQNRKADHELA